MSVDTRSAATIIQAKPAAGLQRLRYLLLLWNSNTTDGTHISPDAVHQAADERLMQVMPQVLPPAGEAGRVEGNNDPAASTSSARGERP